MNLRIRLMRCKFDGLVFAVCKHGSWKAIATFNSLEAARGAL